ncbi:4-(cytidine 5'-diphospho)-2-C-methyl-D-erythritol kinase [soil metagenome]
MLTLKAYAKVNLGLSVLGKRADGFHELDTLFARVALHDTVILEKATGVSLEVAGADLPTDRRNLTYRAAEFYLAAAGAGGVRLRLDKRIPIAAGLGGGSADAAAVLRGLARLYPAEIDVFQLAQTLGSDVPFFVHDLAAARGRGRGELLEPVTLPPLHLVLVNPGVAVSAQDAYAAVTRYDAPLDLESLLKDLGTGVEPDFPNTLQAGVVGLEPVVGDVLTALQATPLRGAVMSGSGSTCFGLARDEAEARTIAEALQTEHPSWWVRATRTV